LQRVRKAKGLRTKGLRSQKAFVRTVRESDGCVKRLASAARSAASSPSARARDVASSSARRSTCEGGSGQWLQGQRIMGRERCASDLYGSGWRCASDLYGEEREMCVRSVQGGRERCASDLYRRGERDVRPICTGGGKGTIAGGFSHLRGVSGRRREALDDVQRGADRRGDRAQFLCDVAGPP